MKDCSSARRRAVAVVSAPKKTSPEVARRKVDGVLVNSTGVIGSGNGNTDFAATSIVVGMARIEIANGGFLLSRRGTLVVGFFLSSFGRRIGDDGEVCFRSAGNNGGDAMLIRSCGGDVIFSNAPSSVRTAEPGDSDSLVIVEDRFTLVTSFPFDVFDGAVGELRRGSRKRENIAHLVEDG